MSVGPDPQDRATAVLVGLGVLVALFAVAAVLVALVAALGAG